jgi:micrococcal nuclease
MFRAATRRHRIRCVVNVRPRALRRARRTRRRVSPSRITRQGLLLGTLWGGMLGALFMLAQHHPSPATRNADAPLMQATDTPEPVRTRSARGPTVSTDASPVEAYHTFRVFNGRMPICSTGRRMTCLVDGDTGWEDGRKWRLRRIDTPELSNPRCDAEYRKAIRARDYLASLMRNGYRVEWSGKNDRYGRALVDIRLWDGSTASDALLDAGLAQPWPNSGNIWCR